MQIYGGIQQIGIGVHNGVLMQNFYESVLGFDVPMFYEEGSADLMQPYTGGRSWNRKAMLVANLHGGAALELWQYTERPRVPVKHEVGIGNLGILCACMRCNNIESVRKNLLSAGHEVTRITEDLGGNARCYVRDPEHNWIGLVESSDGWLRKKAKSVGGVCSVVIGVSDIDKSMHFYSTVCGYDTPLCDELGVFEEFDAFRAQQRIRRVLLTSSSRRSGAFAHLLQSSTKSWCKPLKGKMSMYMKTTRNAFGETRGLYTCALMLGI